MDERHVTHIRRQTDGGITALGNPSEPWSPRQKDDVIDDIIAGQCIYFVVVHGRRRAVGVVEGPDGPELRTELGPAGHDALDQLPDA
jgi:hypothetical protein